ncbi:30S ribosomal protein S6 [Phototrophicus methaneseepsis]|uniref:Small ribosomal subunit protein bS6 n=1 Tax=Phototrophicus methaneseepsis TaxID=2710758 RepID=A0A7S8E5R1_9CHLR|nr:30S ribosomal protein S6 [Phototrophicus methaneseepsis]QPC80874.1 30S ribosomal protein S6 [Phototrophicus methaneseepsis]
MKRPYELTFIFRILSNDDEMQAALDQVVSWIEGEDNEFGSVTRIDRSHFGRRKLAYEIDGQRDGFYIIISADVDPQHLPELELNLKVFSPLLRYLIIRDEDAEREARGEANESAPETTSAPAEETPAEETPADDAEEAPAEEADAAEEEAEEDSDEEE